ncbi:hypothetical protein Glove_120g6 [Diversispora epigaea]|uniref:Uncharacterized protein n=1 Tax=Diversispora epigaea TaxID=1348612 RepID=A0A397J3I6_9GLOM|nr:hypothetical protein Glove_120g6 [Diversispora epigaea]
MFKDIINGGSKRIQYKHYLNHLGIAMAERALLLMKCIMGILNKQIILKYIIMTTQENERWMLRLPYFKNNEAWNLIDYLHWSIVSVSDFGKKEEEHRIYIICLEEIAQSPELLETRNAESIKKLASRCLKSLEREKKLPEVRAFWRSKTSVMKTLKKASTLNSNNIINRMLDLHRDFNEALSNTTRQNIKPALGKKRTKNEAEFDTDSSDTISDDNNEENFGAPEMEEEVTLLHKRRREVSRDLLYPQSEEVPKIEVLERLETKSRLEKYNIFCLFDIEFHYTKQLFTKLSTDRMNAIKSKWTMAEESINKKEIEECWNTCLLKKLVDDYNEVVKENVNEDTFCTDFNSLMTGFTKQQFDKYEHQKNYELFWCQDFYTQLTLQLLRKHSALLDSSTSEYQYRDEIVNPLLASIFFDTENALWLKTGEIENATRKRQRNFLKQENERERLGDKHDGILYMNVQGAPVEIGFLEVVGNAFTKIISDKNDDLEKLLKAMMISLWYQHAHQSEESIPGNMKLQSFSILVFGRKFHFLSMHFIDGMYIVDEFDAFVIPDSGMNFSQIGIIIEIIKKFKIRLIKYYRQIIQTPRKVTRLPKSGLPTASPLKSKSKKKSKSFASDKTNESDENIE